MGRCPVKRASVTAVTANIGRGVDTVEAARNVDRVMRAYRQSTHRAFGPSIGWQEIDEADAPNEHGLLHQALMSMAARHRGEFAGFETATPIYVAPGWSIVRQRVDLTSRGRPHLTPHRVAVQALLEHDDTGLRLVHINGHYPRLPIRDLWIECDASWRDVIVPRWLDQGYSCLLTRDRNRRADQSVPLAPGERQLLAATLIDQVSFIPAAIGTPRAVRLMRRGPARTVDLTVDGHNAHGRPLTFYLPR